MNVAVIALLSGLKSKRDKQLGAHTSMEVCSGVPLRGKCEGVASLVARQMCNSVNARTTGIAASFHGVTAPCDLVESR